MEANVESYAVTMLNTLDAFLRSMSWGTVTFARGLDIGWISMGVKGYG
jgi:hypothetical protein